MRYINKNAIHVKAVQIGRASKNNMKRTANRLAACNVDNQVDNTLSTLKPEAWKFNDETIIEACARRLWQDFCQAEINLQTR
jgi:hypothetical protein